MQRATLWCRAAFAHGSRLQKFYKTQKEKLLLPHVDLINDIVRARADRAGPSDPASPTEAARRNWLGQREVKALFTRLEVMVPRLSGLPQKESSEVRLAAALLWFLRSARRHGAVELQVENDAVRICCGGCKLSRQLVDGNFSTATLYKDPCAASTENN